MKMRAVIAMIAMVLTCITGVTMDSTAVSAAAKTGTPIAVPSSARVQKDVLRAAKYAADHHVKAGIAILDTKTGVQYTGGKATTWFPSASVVKVYMAIFLKVTGRMTEANKKIARPMIRRSSNEAFLYFLHKYFDGSPTRLYDWMQKHYAFDEMGGPVRTTKSSCWGNTHITAVGMTNLYNRVLQDKKVRPWLIGNMQRYVRNVGFNQAFGIPRVLSRSAIKQGWTQTCSVDRPYVTVMNSTGVVRNGRYTVAILTASRGGFGSLTKVINKVARIALKHLRK